MFKCKHCVEFSCVQIIVSLVSVVIRTNGIRTTADELRERKEPFQLRIDTGSSDLIWTKKELDVPHKDEKYAMAKVNLCCAFC